MIVRLLYDWNNSYLLILPEESHSEWMPCWLWLSSKAILSEELLDVGWQRRDCWDNPYEFRQLFVMSRLQKLTILMVNLWVEWCIVRIYVGSNFQSRRYGHQPSLISYFCIFLKFFECWRDLRQGLVTFWGFWFFFKVGERLRQGFTIFNFEGFLLWNTDDQQIIFFEVFKEFF